MPVLFGDVGARIAPMGWQEVANAVVNRRVGLGMRTRKQLADISGLTVKTLGEIERAERTSYDPATLAVVEQTLKWPAGTIASIASASVRTAADAVTGAMDARIEDLRREVQRAVHPAAAEAAELLAADSPLSPQTRDRLASALEVLLEAARRDFRDVPPSRESADMAHPRRPGVDPVVVTHPDGDHWSTGRALDAFLNPDTRIGERDREAIRRLMAAALQLGETAMLAYDAQQDEPGPFDEMPVGDPRAAEGKARDGVR